MAIVNINVSVTNPPAPSQLLKSGAMISMGGTTLNAGEYQLLTSASDLASILSPAKSISTIAWATGTVTVTLSAAHGWTNGSSVPVLISGVAPAGYNGAYTATVTGTNTFTYPLTSNPGTATTMGSVKTVVANEISQMNTSYWAQGTSRAVYVLELGAVTNAAAITALTNFIAEDVALGNTYQKFFSYLVPREWDGESTFKTLTGLYTSPGSLVYFFVTTTIATYDAWKATANKSVFAGVEAPSIAATEFSMATAFQSALSNDPGSSNMVPPMAYRFLYGVTEYPVKGNSTLLQTLQDNDINYVGTAAEGGLSNKMLVAGHMLDGHSTTGMRWPGAQSTLSWIWQTKSSTVRTRTRTRCITSSGALIACKIVRSKHCVTVSVTALFLGRLSARNSFRPISTLNTRMELTPVMR